ncbi:hypothetical protein J6590_064354 [Homalodisca vitripennis]|nr:hypothetical protein J6590_064354 [Homalodisca vitripennis]
MLQVRGKKHDWKSGKSQGIRSQVREFRRWSGKNIKSLDTNKLTAAAPSPSLQTTRRMKQAAEAARPAIKLSSLYFLLFYICHPVSLNTAFFHPLIAKNPGDCVKKSQGKMKNLVWKSGKSQGISLLDSCSNPVLGYSIKYNFNIMKHIMLVLLVSVKLTAGVATDKFCV